jgi:hypothetical protein
VIKKTRSDDSTWVVSCFLHLVCLDREDGVRFAAVYRKS